MREGLFLFLPFTQKGRPSGQPFQFSSGLFLLQSFLLTGLTAHTRSWFSIIWTRTNRLIRTRIDRKLNIIFRLVSNNFSKCTAGGTICLPAFHTKNNANPLGILPKRNQLNLMPFRCRKSNHWCFQYQLPGEQDCLEFPVQPVPPGNIHNMPSKKAEKSAFRSLPRK